RPRGSMMNPTLKKRSFRSGWRAFACAMTNAWYSLAILPSSSVSSPGISIAHSRAKVAWSRSSTSSLNACSAPSGKAISLTGISRLDSHDAAFTRCERCSRLILMSLRLRMPRTVGTRPTAVYGLIMRALLEETSAGGNARHFPDAIVVQLDRHLVLSGAVAVGAAIDHRAPPRRRHTLALLVGPPEPRHDLATGAHAALPPDRGGRRDLLELEVVGVAEVGDDQRVLAGQVHDPVAALVVEREEPERGRPQVAEARREDVAPAPEEFVDP